MKVKHTPLTDTKRCCECGTKANLTEFPHMEQWTADNGDDRYSEGVYWMCSICNEE